MRNIQIVDKMNAIEFNCVINEITKKLGIQMDADLVGKIYDIYEGTYDNYTLLELIGLLEKYNIEITCPWNKRAIIKMIEDQKLDIPKKYEPMQPTTFQHYRVRRSLDILNTRYMEFYDGCIVQTPDGQAQKILFLQSEEELISDDLDPYQGSSYKSTIFIYFENMATKEETEMTAKEFIWKLDNLDCTILQDQNRQYFMNEEEKHFWTNHVRVM